MREGAPMPLDDCFESALQSPEPVSRLRSLAREMLSRGLDQALILERFEAARRGLREADRERDEEAVMDVMDCLVGWCSPQLRHPEDWPSEGDRPPSPTRDGESSA